MPFRGSTLRIGGPPVVGGPGDILLILSAFLNLLPIGEGIPYLVKDEFCSSLHEFNVSLESSGILSVLFVLIQRLCDLLSPGFFLVLTMT